MFIIPLVVFFIIGWFYLSASDIAQAVEKERRRAAKHDEAMRVHNMEMWELIQSDLAKKKALLVRPTNNQTR